MQVTLEQMVTGDAVPPDWLHGWSKQVLPGRWAVHGVRCLQTWLHGRSKKVLPGRWAVQVDHNHSRESPGRMRFRDQCVKKNVPQDLMFSGFS